MEDGSRSIEERVGALERRLDALEKSLVARVKSQVESLVESQVGETEADLRLGTSDVRLATSDLTLQLFLTLSGRTFLIIGGAYLLRALTDAGALPVPAGIAVGFAYAAAWLIAADRAAATRRQSAIAHGFTASLIAYPLLWEASTRFGLFGAAATSAALVAVTIAVLGIAIRARLQPVAWIAVCASMAGSVALTAATGFIRPLAIADVLIGIATLWIGYTIDWIWLRWIPAIVADTAVLVLATAPAGRAGTPMDILATQLLLLAGYHTSIAIRTLVRGREINPFEVLQATASLAVGFGGAVYVAGRGSLPVAAFGVVAATGCYAVAFAFVAKRQGLHRNFYFYTSLGLIFAIVSTTAALEAVSAALIWAALAIAVAWTAPRVRHFALAIHAAVYLVSAVFASGLATTAARAIWGDPAAAQFASPAVAAVFAACWLCWAAAPVEDRRVPALWTAIARVPVAVAAAWAAAAAVVAAATFVSIDPGFIATARTAAIAIGALVLAGFGRSSRFVEASWLVYPVLVLCAIKLAVEDLARSRPSTLFLALALYGFALIAAPRLVKRPTPRATGA